MERMVRVDTFPIWSFAGSSFVFFLPKSTLMSALLNLPLWCGLDSVYLSFQQIHPSHQQMVKYLAPFPGDKKSSPGRDCLNVCARVQNLPQLLNNYIDRVMTKNKQKPFANFTTWMLERPPRPFYVRFGNFWSSLIFLKNLESWNNLNWTLLWELRFRKHTGEISI